jgi:hypothetical protein
VGESRVLGAREQVDRRFGDEAVPVERAVVQVHPGDTDQVIGGAEEPGVRRDAA